MSWKEEAPVSSSLTTWTWPSWTRAAQILNGLTSFTYTNQECKEEMISVRLSGDVPIGSFAGGPRQGLSTLGRNPGLKGKRVRAEPEERQPREAKGQSRGVFPLVASLTILGSLFSVGQFSPFF